MANRTHGRLLWEAFPPLPPGLVVPYSVVLSDIFYFLQSTSLCFPRTPLVQYPLAVISSQLFPPAVCVVLELCVQVYTYM